MSSFISSATLLSVAALVLLMWAVVVYNKLVRLRNASVNAFSQIDVQLKRRYDLIPNLVEVARKYMQHEATTLDAVTRARNQALLAAQACERSQGANASLSQLGAAEVALGGAMSRFMATVEAYPELKADASMKSLSEELVSTENRVAFARQGYNDVTTDFNNAVEQFPALLVARMMGFIKRELLNSTENEQERASVKVSF